MKFLKTALILLALTTAFSACTPYARRPVGADVRVGVGYGPRPYYRPYRPYYRRPVVVVPPRRVAVRPHPGYYKSPRGKGYYQRGSRRGGRW
jgi:hypothetical protein